MKVMYFHQYFSTASGSTSTRSLGTALALLDLGHEVTVVCISTDRNDTGLTGTFSRGRREGVVQGIRVIELELSYSNYQSYLKRSLGFLSYAFRSSWIAVKSDADIIFATSTPLTAGIPGIVAKALRWNKRFIFEVRDLWPELPREMGVIKNPVVLGMMEVLERASYLFATACIGLSPGIVDGIQRKASAKKRVALVPNASDLSLFGRQPRDPGAARRVRPPALSETRYDILFTASFKCVFAGTHGVANGLDAVLDAAAELSASGAPVDFIFVGDGKEKPALVGRAESEMLSNCHFFDSVEKAVLDQIYQRVDVGLMILANVPAFYYGTSPNKFFDYIAAGLPVLNNYPGWLAGLIDEHGCGVAVPPGDPAAIAAALLELRQHPEVVRDMGGRSRELAEEHFSYVDLSRQAAEFIASVYDEA